MKITEITVHAGRTFSHPFEQYSNLRPEVQLRATLDDGDDPVISVKNLQRQAEELVERQKQQILADLRQLERKARLDSSIASTEKQIKKLTDELNELKNGNVKELEGANDWENENE